MTSWTAGDFDYDARGDGYTNVRRPDPRIAAQIAAALGDARTVVNVGAGAGSYEPTDRYVSAIEPSATMRAQRPSHVVPAINATAEALPFDDQVFDAAMAVMTVHHWPDAAAGLSELRRVTRGRVVILTFDGPVLEQFWLNDYAPELIAVDRRRSPPIELICDTLGGTSEVDVVTIPFDCTDGFGDAFYGRPERFLDSNVRAAQSGWGFVSEDAERHAVELLRSHLESGEWDRRHGHLRTQSTFDGAVRLITASPNR